MPSACSSTAASPAAEAGPGAGPDAGPDGAEALALYVHWPFCQSKCPYCDFNSHVRETVDHQAWRDALLADLDWEAARTGPRTLQSIFFGGGTPSLMPPETVAAVIGRATTRWAAAPDLEVTLEANPGSVEVARFRGYAAAGVNRVSIGVQSLHDDDLRRLGRLHDAAAARHAVATAAAIFPRFSFDLIYGRPGQGLDDWRDELREGLAMAGGHLSLYTLTLEPNTGFYGAWRRGALQMPEDEAVAAQFDLTQEMCAAAGLPAYEISNHARSGEESRHNLVYWRYGDYAGIGPGAHGRLGSGAGRIASRRIAKPEAWLARVTAAGHGIAAEEPVEQEAQWPEALMMGLRLVEGIDLARLRARIGRPETGAIDGAALERFLREGLLRRDGDRLAATADGRNLLNALLGRLIA